MCTCIHVHVHVMLNVHVVSILIHCILLDEYHMSRTQSDLTQVKAVIEDLNNKEKRSIPPGYYPQVRIIKQMDGWILQVLG